MTEKELSKTRALLSERIKIRRAELGISQESLAEKTGMGIATIKRFESGKFWINMKQYILIRSALQLPEMF